MVLFVQMPTAGVFDGLYIRSDRGPNATFALLMDGKVTMKNLIPGTQYDFFISTTSGNMLSSVYHVPSVRTCKSFISM